MGGAGLDLVGGVTRIEGQAEPLAFLDHQGVEEAVLGLGLGGSLILGGGIGEKQMVRDVFIAGGALLRQEVRPAKEFQDGPDQVLLGDRLVGLAGLRQGCQPGGDAVPERPESIRL